MNIDTLKFIKHDEILEIKNAITNKKKFVKNMKKLIVDVKNNCVKTKYILHLNKRLMKEKNSG